MLGIDGAVSEDWDTRLVAALRATTGDLSSPALQMAVADAARILARSDSAALYLRDAGSMLCVAVSDAGGTEASSRGALSLHEHAPPLRQMYANLLPIVFSDTAQNPAWADIAPSYPHPERIRSWIGLPLAVAGRLLGILAMGFERPDAFGTGAQLSLVQFAESAALSLRNARLIAEGAATARFATLRASIGTELWAARDQAEMFQGAVEGIGHALQASHCAIYAVRSSARIAAMASYPQDDPLTPQAELVLQPVISLPLQHGRTLWVADVDADAHADDAIRASRETLLANGIRAVLVVPISRGSEILGLFVAVQLGRPRHWEAGEIVLLEQMAGDLARAFGRAGAAPDLARIDREVREEATREERERLAREIHDGLAQTITSIVMLLDTLARATPEDAPIHERLEQTRALAREAVAETRRVVWNLKPAGEIQETPRAVVEREINSFERRTGIRPELIAAGEERPVAPEIAAAVQRLIHEALQNAASHSNATRVRILLDYGLKILSLQIEDDGEGSDPEALDLGADSKIGLAGVAERIRLVGGSVRIESAAGMGTRVHAELPYTPTAPAQLVQPQPRAADRELGRQPASNSAARPSANRIRAVLIDDHTVVREGLVRMLQDQPDLEVVGAAATGSDGLRMIAEHRPDVVLCDLQLPDMSGAEVIARVRAHFPEIPCLVVTTYDNDESIYESVKAGAKGYVLKDVTAAELGDAVRAASRNESLIQPIVARKLVDRLGEMARQGQLIEPLTDRELGVLQALAGGSRNKEIAFELGLSESTIKTHLASIFGKLNVTTRTEAVTRGRELGLISL